MLRKELVIGYGVAGFLTVLVPTHVWSEVFVEGHGFWTSLENVLIGPFIACVSFVCSIGNVPMAAALWHGGISFGGVISFIFADLIALPLLLVYRKYYGTRLTVRLFVWFYVVMAAAGLLVEGAVLGSSAAIPTRRAPARSSRPTSQWNYTTFLNIAFLVVFARHLLVVPRPERVRGSTSRTRSIPVCSMQVEKANAPAHVVHDGTRRVVLLRPLPRALRARYFFFLTVRRGEVPSRRSSTSPTVRSRTVDSGSGRSC